MYLRYPAGVAGQQTEERSVEAVEADGPAVATRRVHVEDAVGGQTGDYSHLAVARLVSGHLHPGKGIIIFSLQRIHQEKQMSTNSFNIGWDVFFWQYISLP